MRMPKVSVCKDPEGETDAVPAGIQPPPAPSHLGHRSLYGGHYRLRVQLTSSSLRHCHSKQCKAFREHPQAPRRPPSGVQAQFEFYGEGDGVCLDLENTSDPSVVPSYYPKVGNEIHVLQYLDLCFPGFLTERSITLELNRPDNKTELLSVESQVGAQMLSIGLVFLPNDPLGSYTFIARQGDLQAETGLTLRPTSEPSLSIVKGRSPQFNPRYARGDTVPVALAGFPAGQLIPVDIYKKSDTNANTAKEVYQYRTSIGIRINGSGEAMYDLPTKEDDPVGCYALAVRQYELRSYFCID